MFDLYFPVVVFTEIGINLLLCLSVYLTILNTKMPTRSDAFPLLSKFYGCCIFILTCALLCTCWVVAYYFHDMSGWEIYSMSKFVEVRDRSLIMGRRGRGEKFRTFHLLRPLPIVIDIYFQDAPKIHIEYFRPPPIILCTCSI